MRDSVNGIFPTSTFFVQNSGIATDIERLSLSVEELQDLAQRPVFGHAAKFAALLGHIMADLAIDGATGYGIETWKLDRPALTDPGFPTDFRMANAAQAQHHNPWETS